MKTIITKIGKRGTLVIPAEARKALQLKDDDPVSVRVNEERGTIEITPQLSVDRTQAWFWTPEWQAGEREADEDLKAGRFTVMTAEQFKKGIDTRAARKDRKPRQVR
ncbi:MAG: AbrB/MazE/SpoVT family DNA-binding domain-containing protein [Thermoleophilia bacterium]